MTLEICANSYQSAIHAQQAGAHRIEFCSELTVGGITPSYGLLKQVLSRLKIPVFVLIRPRSGDFVYTEEEFNAMKMDIELSKDLGAQGIVSGVLTKDHHIDEVRTCELVELARPLQFTFHRAFDEIINPMEGLEQLIHMGVDRLLSSGQQSTAHQGLELLERLVEQSAHRIIVMAGSGVTPENVSDFRRIGIKEVHASASSLVEKRSGLFSIDQSTSDPIKIKSLLDAL